ncbi:MAG: SRPBCC family protein [Thermoanaerobaculales bacterium]
MRSRRERKEATVEKPEFVYVTYIASTPEKIWAALTEPEITTKYWQQVNLSDWKPGSKWEHRSGDQERILRLVGKVIESTPLRRLVISWAFPADEANEAKHTRVTFEIEPYRDVVRLTVTHDRLEPDSEMLKGITKGWPMVLASLKSLLEVGKPLPKLW